jgi:ribosomal protein S12 methylthiotransferase accessory factor YcaO
LFQRKPSLHLKSRKKWIGSNSGGNKADNILTSRIKPPKETLDKVIPICRKIGVTRIADITYMDKLYIPNYSAVLPETKDPIWVYHGKGPTKVHAKASALMETIERYCALPNTTKRKFISGTYDDLAKKYKVLHTDEVVEAVRFEYKNDMVMDFLSGINLFTNEQILVPSSLALYQYVPKEPSVNPFAYTHTVGLASGNVIEEAICHALCEVIERDAVSLATLCASAIPYKILENILNSLKEIGYPIAVSPNSMAEKYVDDSSIFPDVNVLPSEEDEEEEKLFGKEKCATIKNLVKRFAKAGLPLLVKEITQEDIGIPTFIASSTERISSDYGFFVYGYGTHPDARIALIRAITEISQNRAGNVQGARDDLVKIKFKEDSKIDKRMWQFIPSSSSSSFPSSYLYNGNNTNKNTTKKFSEIKTYVNEDILDDIKLILSCLKQSGLKKAIVVDLTNTNIGGIPVVRVIVPGLETFEISKSVMGRRAKEHFKKKMQTKT